jgi:hypothetical protein
MKNTLAENMLRFGTKLTESDKRKVSRLAEQDNRTYDSILVTNAAKATNEKVATQIETDADVVFLGSVESLKPVRQYYAFSKQLNVNLLPMGSDYMLILGKIGIFKTDKMGKPGEIFDIKYRAFYAFHGGNSLRIMQQFDTPGNYQQLIKTLAADYENRTSSGRDDFWNTYADGLFSLYTKSGIAIGQNEFYKNGKSAAIS